MSKLCSDPLCPKVPPPCISPEVPSAHSRKLAKLYGADATTRCWPRKMSHTTFSLHGVLFSFLCEVMPFTLALYHCSLCASLPDAWVSLSCSSLSLFLTQLFYDYLPVLCRVDLHIQYVTDVFSIEPCCGSLLGESLSYHLLGRPACWIFRFSSWISTSETRDGAAGRGAFLVLWELSDVL